MPKANVASQMGNEIHFITGGRKIVTTSAKLREMRSKVRTHEGETLMGREGRRYMDKYSKKYLGRDLERSYMDKKIIGEVQRI